MSNKKDKHIKNIISKVGIDKAPADFTNKVMQDVFVSTNEEALKDKTLASLLERTIIEKPSDTFLSDIMAQVETKKKVEFQPLISKKGWSVILSLFTIFVLYLIFNDGTEESASVLNNISPYLEASKNLFSNLFKGFYISPLLAISIFSLTILLFLDGTIKRRVFS